MSRALARTLSIALSVGALAAIAYVVTRPGRDPQSVRMVDNREDLGELLRQRALERERELEARGAVTVEPDPSQAWRPLQRTPVGVEEAARFYFSLATELERPEPRKVFDPRAYFANRPGWSHRLPWGAHPDGGWLVEYSQAGFRNPYEPRDPPPELRVILCGDSHMEGLAPYEDTTAAVLERELRAALGTDSVEVLNGAAGGYDFYNYLGVLENSLRWNPDVFVVVVYGGNDFVGVLPAHAYFERVALDIPERSWWEERVRGLDQPRTGLMAQAFQQLLHFQSRPQNADFALDAALRAVLEMEALARREGIALVVAYLPPATDVRPQDAQPRLDEWIRVLELEEEDLRITDRLADRFIAELGAHGVRVHDLRPALREASGPLFWRADLHLDMNGLRLVAQELLPLVLERRSTER